MTTPEGRARGEIATRWVELAVAMLFALAGAIVIVDSVRIGYTWAEDGPKAGYFPFYIGCILVACGAYVALQTIWRWKKLDGLTFVTVDRLKPVFLMLLKTFVDVTLPDLERHDLRDAHGHGPGPVLRAGGDHPDRAVLVELEHDRAGARVGHPRRRHHPAGASEQRCA